jgi:putative DNA primase/helicase
MLHDSGEYYVYKHNYWQSIDDKKLKRIIRRFFMKYEADWSPAVEKRYMASFDYECWEMDELDVEGARNYINLKNGLLDIRDFKLKPHSKWIFSTIQMPTEYKEPEGNDEFDPKKTCPNFFDFLRTILSENGKKYRAAKMTQYMQMLMGYCLSNSIEAHKLWFFLGSGSNGKSVLCDVLTELVGGIENISTVSLERFKSVFSVSQIRDKTLNISTENEVKGALNTQLIKAITSGDPIQVEEKFKNPLTYRPTAKLIFSVNKMPTIKDTSYGFGRRLDIVPFKIKFVREPKAANERKLVPNYTKKLLKEREGIFAFAIEGLKLLKNRKYRFPEPEAIIEQSKKIGRSESLCPDFINAFVDVEDKDDWIESKTKRGTPILTSKNGTREPVDDIFAAFIGWCLRYRHSQDAKTYTKERFLREFRVTLKEIHGFKDKDSEKRKNLCENEGNSGSETYFNCLRLNDDAKEAMEEGRRFIIKNSLAKKQLRS